MKKIACIVILLAAFSCALYCEDFDSFIKNKTYLPVEYLDALKGEDRNILLKYNPQIENNSEYDFAFERDTEWYENGTFRYMEFSMRMDLLYLGNSFFIEICEVQEETFGYNIKGKQTSHSKESFDGTYPCLVNLSPLENLNTDDELKIETDGDYITCSLASRKFSHKYFLVDKETFSQIESLLATNVCELSKVTWPRHADGSCDYEDGGKSAAESSVRKPAPAVGKTMTVRENLKLRSGEATSTQVLAVMSAGTHVKVLELGKTETIDGISSNWVKVEVQGGAKDKDGNPIRAGTTGWCYGGYLE